MQFKAFLGITCPIQGTSREKLCEELGLHSLAERRWCNKKIFLYKIVNGLLPDYIYSHLNFASQQNYPLRFAKVSKIRPISTWKNSFKQPFFPYCINVWNNLKANIRNVKLISIFKKLIVSKRHGNSLFSLYEPLGKNCLHVRLNYSHVKEHKFRNGFLTR